MVNQSPARVLFFAHETTWSGPPIQLLHLAQAQRLGGRGRGPETEEGGVWADLG